MAEKTDRMRKQKQTNRELFMEKLQDADMKKFVELITCHGKCTRCSNNYWDGNYTGCHENKNESSCEEGIAEFMEARPGENSGLHERHKRRVHTADSLPLPG